MPKANDHPENLRPYISLGVDLSYTKGDKEATGECPFCGGSKFSVKVETGQGRCFKCAISLPGKKGFNKYSFLELLHNASYPAPDKRYVTLAKGRKLLFPATPKEWEVGRSIASDEWIVPGYSAEGKIMTLNRITFLKNPKTGKKKMRVIPCAGLGTHLYGVSLYDSSKDFVCLCEGIWDAMSLREALSISADNGDWSFESTEDPADSLLRDFNVLGVPGSEVNIEPWIELFRGKKVFLMNHNDHPTEDKQGKEIEPAGLRSVKRIAGLLANVADEVHFIQWSKKGYTRNLPKGFDVRDYLSKGEDNKVPDTNIPERVQRLCDLLQKVKPVPKKWIKEAREHKEEAPKLKPIKCESWKTLVLSWKKAMKWTEGLDRGLSVMLASVISTNVLGDQLWIKLIGPASCGKSTLCEALSINTRYCYPKSTIRGFHSGFNSGSGEDNSLIDKIRGKSLITKDGDTLLQSPNLPQILSEARDIYDGTSRSHYRTGTGKDYSGVRTTWILAGTASLRKIDSSELGERFLDCVIMTGIDPALEDDVTIRVAMRAERNMSIEADPMKGNEHDPKLSRAMQLTGGYVSYLRENATQLLSSISMPHSRLVECANLGKFLAYMRARPSRIQDEDAEREFSARLVSQHVRLAKCLAAVLGKSTVDNECMRRAARVTMDTARGKTLNIIHKIYEAKGGLEIKSISTRTHLTDAECRRLIRFLGRIGAIRTQRTGPRRKRKVGSVKWVLSRRLEALYESTVVKYGY